MWVGTGSRHEKAQEHGLSHLIEHMAFKGTTRRSARQIAEDIENVGGDINAATSVEYTSYTARVLGENIDVALDVLGDILINSAFDAAELAREKGVILQEYAAVEDTPDDLVYDAFMETAFAGQPIGRPILGTPDTIKSFDETTIRAFLAREYAPGKMVLAAAGNVDHARSSRRPNGSSAPCRPSRPASRKRSLFGRRAAHLPQARTGQPGPRPAGPVLQGPRLLRDPSVRPHPRRRADLPPLARGAGEPGPRLFDRRLPLALLGLRPLRHRRRDGRIGRSRA